MDEVLGVPMFGELTEPPVVQVEFLLHDAETLEGLNADCLRRREEGSPIKLVLRFYDNVDDGVASLVKKLETAVECRREVRAKLMELPMNVFRTWLLELRLSRCDSTILTLEVERNEAIVALAFERMMYDAPVSIEVEHHRFRQVRNDERYELFEQIRAASERQHVFVFHPQEDLLFEQGTLIASNVYLL